MKRLCILLAAILLFCTACTQPPAQEEGNLIDRAFDRVLGEREELAGNTIFAYLYAKKWHDAFYELDEQTPFWYGTQWDAAVSAAGRFDEIAWFYRALTVDSLERLGKSAADMTVDEEELYLWLSGVTYQETIPETFDSDYFIKAGEEMLENGQQYPMPVYAALPDISLAYAFPFGHVVTVRGESYFYPWTNGQPPARWTYPRLALGDYDGDGKDELAVILLTGAGMGVSVDELYMVDLDTMRDHAVTSQEIAQALYHRLSAFYDPVADAVVVRLDDQTVSVDASGMDKERGDFRGLDLSSIIRFDTDGDVIKVNIWIGVCGFDPAPPFNYVDFYADVNVDGSGNIILANCRIEGPLYD